MRKKKDGRNRQAWCVRTESRLEEQNIKVRVLNWSHMPSKTVKEAPERSSPLTVHNARSHLLKPSSLCLWCIIKKTAAGHWHVGTSSTVFWLIIMMVAPGCVEQLAWWCAAQETDQSYKLWNVKINVLNGNERKKKERERQREERLNSP